VTALARVLAFLGVTFLAAAGLVWLVGRLGWGSFPGTVVVRRGSFTLWAPIGLWVALSLGLTLLLNLWARFLR
jgi:hypothetical protein